MHPSQPPGSEASPDTLPEPSRHELRSVTGREPIAPLPATFQDHGNSYPVSPPAAPPLPSAGPNFLAQPEPGLPHLMSPGGIPLQPICRWNKHLVLDRFGPPLPTDRCFRCNEPATRTKRKTFYSQSAGVLLIALLIPLLLLIMIVAYFITQKKVSIEFGLCERCHQRRMIRATLAAVIPVLTVVGGIIASMHVDPIYILLGAFPILCLTIFGCFLTPFAQVPRFNGRWIHLKAGSRAFNESFPESDVPQF